MVRAGLPYCSLSVSGFPHRRVKGISIGGCLPTVIENMRRLWALIIIVVLVVAAIPTYWVLTHLSSSSPCNSGGVSTPLVEPQGGPQFVLAYNNSVKEGTTWWFNFSVLMSFTASVGELTLHVLLINGTPVDGVRAYWVWNRVPAVVATANGTNSTWVSGASLPLQSLDTVTAVSLINLTGDRLFSTIPGPCGVTWTTLDEIGP